MGIEYLGHKESLLDFVLEPIDQASAGAPLRVADLFCGTGSVSVALKARGHTVLANDALAMCATLARAALLNDRAPAFAGVADDVPGAAYPDVLRFLEALPPREGFVTRNWSPRSAACVGHERRYFTEENAARIDAVRARIEAWGDRLAPNERALLLADLLRGASAVSNVAGTYGCYLKRWKARALAPLRLVPSTFTPGGHGHAVTCGDAAALAPTLDVDLVYADPPYTKRQYAAYYHVPETIVLDDAPALGGSTGLRPWRDKASAWCHRRHAPAALAALVAASPGAWFVLSYNEDGQIPHEAIVAILGAHGEVTVQEHVARRYKSADRPHRGQSVRERLYVLRRRANP